ncbi:hypothetical protein HDV00_009330 [Rhizophlyctis rosea]|nr:hypothetical protein HDV00_009330 [Rhizophlyctis rosea]
MHFPTLSAVVLASVCIATVKAGPVDIHRESLTVKNSTYDVEIHLDKRGLGDWSFCSKNSDCNNNCCSKEYSTSDGKYKCTPGGTKCTGSGGGTVSVAGDRSTGTFVTASTDISFLGTCKPSEVIWNSWSTCQQYKCLMSQQTKECQAEQGGWAVKHNCAWKIDGFYDGWTDRGELLEGLMKIMDEYAYRHSWETSYCTMQQWKGGALGCAKYEKKRFYNSISRMNVQKKENGNQQVDVTVELQCKASSRACSDVVKVGGEILGAIHGSLGLLWKSVWGFHSGCDV